VVPSWESSAKKEQYKTMTSNLETVKRTYKAFARGDIESVLANFAPDITWVEAEGGPYGGTYHGPQEVLENVFAPINDEWDVFRVVPERFIDGLDTIVATGRYQCTHAETGRSFDAAFAHVWELQNGTIERFEQYVDTALHNEPLPREHVTSSTNDSYR